MSTMKKSSTALILAILMMLSLFTAAFADDGEVTPPPVPVTYPVSVVQATGGTISLLPEQAAFEVGATVALTAVAADGYTFAGWNVSGVALADATAPTAAFLMPEAPVGVTALFTPVLPSTHNIALSSTPDASGTAVASVASAAAGTTVTLTATPAAGYEFVSWIGNVNFTVATNASTTFVMPENDAVIRASFVQKQYKVNFNSEGGGVATCDKESYFPGDEVQISAAPNEGFVFYGWTTSQVKLLNDNAYTTSFTMPENDVAIGVVFAVKQATEVETKDKVAVTFNTDGGTAFGTTYVESGSKVPTPSNMPLKTGYVFAGWYSDVTCTIPFNFSNPIYASTIIYAKWAPEATTVAPTDGYSDVSSGDWFYEHVMTLTEKKIVNGKGGNVFAPNSTITRAEFSQILANLSGATLNSTSTPFSDVPAAQWYAKSVSWAYTNGIVTGTSSTTFAPNALISRQDMAIMIMRYVEKVAKKTLPEKNAAIVFNDSKSIASYAESAVSAMQRAGIIAGRTGNIFDPKANATRAEACKMISVLLSLI